LNNFPTVDDQWIANLFDSDAATRHQLLTNLSDLNTSFCGRTLLHIALEREDLHMVTAMLRFGADPNLRSGHASIVPLGIALKLGRADFAQILIAFGARTDYAKSELEMHSTSSEFLQGNYPLRFKALISGDWS
jgi:ankyrin repeat protein